MDLPWERFIISGPGTVNLLGQLMVVSSKLDFSFRDYQSDYKFVYMRYPNSFRATLTQIANGKKQYPFVCFMLINESSYQEQMVDHHTIFMTNFICYDFQILNRRRKC